MKILLSIDEKIEKAKASTLTLLGVAIILSLCLGFICLASAKQTATDTLEQLHSSVK